VTFIPAYVLRDEENDLPYWLLFLLFFIIDTVICVMNAYNNISWTADRLTYEMGANPLKRGTALACVGI